MGPLLYNVSTNGCHYGTTEEGIFNEEGVRSVQLFDSDAAKLNPCFVAKKSNVTLASPQPRMLFQYCRILHCVEVSVHNDSPVQSHHNAATVGCDLFLIPFSSLLQKASLGRNHIVNRAVVLGGPQLSLVSFGLVVKNLDLHAGISGIAFQGSSDADAVVATFFGPEFKAKHKIRILFLRKQIPASIGRTDQQTVFHDITSPVLSYQHPVVQGLTVKQRDETCLFSRQPARREKEKKKENHFQ